MAGELAINYLKPGGPKMSKQTAVERMYLAADGDRLVGEGDPDAQSLFVTAGKPISAADASRFKIKGGKRRRNAFDKRMKAGEDKGA